VEAGAETVILLGAGASAEAGVPTTFDMTEQLVRRIDDRRYDQHPTAAALHFVCGALLAYDGAAGHNPFVGLDVERVFAAVELLAERNTLEVSPFVASWHRAVDAMDAPDELAIGNFNHHFERALSQPHSFGGVKKLITDLIDIRTGSAANGYTYKELAAAMLAELRELVVTTPKEVGYLTPIAERGERDGGLTIATLNYDLSIEHVADVRGVSCTTGVERWLETGRWDWPSEGIRLLKLHGSINWVWDRGEHIDGHLPRETLHVMGDPEDSHMDDGRPGVVFGQRGKLRAQGPFLGLLAELEKMMSSARRLIVIGYSFRDDHVNELIQRWTYEDVDRKILVVDPHWPEEFPYPGPGDFKSNLNNYLIPPPWAEEPKFAPRLEVFREKCSDALLHLFWQDGLPARH
jgi:hypothetical protein